MIKDELEQQFINATKIVALTHKNDVDKASKPYIGHLRRVHDKATTLKERIIALLHDLVEDHPEEWSFDRLRLTGFDESIVLAIDCLTHRKDESYEDYISRIIPNFLAAQVKIYDLEDNMDIRRLDIITDKDVDRLNKYLKAYKRLTENHDRV